MKLPIKNIVFVAGAGAATLIPVQLSAKVSQPNIILIVVDDVGYGDFSCYGNKDHNTPNIDRLAKEGVKFTDFHSNGSVSSPTRCALMTGRYQQHSGIEGVVTASKHRDCGLPLGSNTIAKMLSGNGYDCAMYGKWHLGYQPRFNPINFGFDHFVGYVSGNVDYFSHIDQAGYKDWWHNDELVEEEGYTPYLVTEYAERYIQQKRENPFFLYLPYETAHGPFQGPDDEVIRSLVNGKLVNNKNYSKDASNVRYKNMLEAFDGCVGRLVEATERAGIAEDTLIILFSDNGGANLSCNKPLAGKKGTLYEGGHRVAAMTYWRGKIKGGRVSDQTLMTFDIMPTLCDITNTSMSGVESDGVSFYQTMMRGSAVGDRSLFWRAGKSLAARKGDWKLLIDGKTKGVALYNLSTDIGEQNDVKEQYPEIAQQLQAELAEWEEQFRGVTMDAPKHAI